MKRILALTLMLVLVLSMGAMAQTIPYDIGTLEDDGDLEIEFGFTVDIGKFARVWLQENLLFQNQLLGQAGLYTSDENQVIALAKDYFAAKFNPTYWPEIGGDGYPWLGEDDNDEGYDRQGGALFRIESNCDTLVDVDFEWAIEEKTLSSEMVLWVFRHENTQTHPKFPPVNGAGADSMISTGINGTRSIQFKHDYEGQHEFGREYKIGGALFIDFISQQQADTYEGVITITVAAE